MTIQFNKLKTRTKNGSVWKASRNGVHGYGNNQDSASFDLLKTEFLTKLQNGQFPKIKNK